MKIGILQTGHVPDELRDANGDYDVMFARLLDGQGFSFGAYDVEGGVIPGDPHECDGWLITGSRHGAYEDHPWIAPLEAFIRAAFGAGVPQVGICFGHQIIAQALGGKVEKFSGGWAVGRQDYDWNGKDLALNAWHQDQVVRRPEGAEVIATNGFCENAALIYGKRAFTVQPHPEFGPDFVDGLIHTRGKGVVPDELMAAAAERLDLALDDATVARKIGAFFREAAHG